MRRPRAKPWRQFGGALALTGIGGIVSFGIGAAGFRAVLRDTL